VKLLLDTHIWLWSLLDPAGLSRSVAGALADRDNELWLSPISVWELGVLVAKGRIFLGVPVADWVKQVMSKVPLKEATLTHEVALETLKVELPHPDPADRFLAATARVFDLTLVTADRRLIQAKGLKVLPNR